MTGRLGPSAFCRRRRQESLNENASETNVRRIESHAGEIETAKKALACRVVGRIHSETPYVVSYKLSNGSARSAGFTLIEVVIASALMALILVSAYACLSAGYASQKIIVPRTEIIQNARVAMALMSADLRAACPLPGDSEFTGMTRTLEDAEADNIDFATHNYTPRHPREGDFCEESFFVDKDAESGQLCLYRRRNPIIAMDPLSGGSREEIARGLRGLKLEYYDGTDWYDTWGQTKSTDKQQTSSKTAGNESGLPNAVRITLYLDSETHHPKVAVEEKPAPPLVFQTVARLNLAEVSQASGSSDAGSSSDASGPGPAGEANSGNN